MLIEFLISGEHFADGLLGGDFEGGAVIVDHVDDLYPPGFLGEFSDDVVGVLPPLDFVVGVDVEVLPLGAVELPGGSFHVHFDPWLPAG